MLKKRYICLLLKNQLTTVLLFLGKKSLQLRSPLVKGVNKTERFGNLKVAFRS